MSRKSLANPTLITVALIVQLIPLVLYPPESYNPASQEWWLPVLLAIFTAIAFWQLVFRHTAESWPWYLISFAQGFNIITRLLMLMPHATVNDNGAQVFNTPYVVLTVIAMLLSVVFLWYTELPDIRSALIRD
ncbi:MAG: hypothetical protein P4L50_30815 [Anaerolineaceae bacterium]|nr:hypothetical protein [Anaerolineaceae bacterium]